MPVNQRKLNILEGINSRKEVEPLKNEAYLSVPNICPLVAVELRYVLVRQIILPDVGASRQPRMFIRVDFPDPDGPMIERNSPGSMVRLILSKAGTSIAPAV